MHPNFYLQVIGAYGLWNQVDCSWNVYCIYRYMFASTTCMIDSGMCFSMIGRKRMRKDLVSNAFVTIRNNSLQGTSCHDLVDVQG